MSNYPHSAILASSLGTSPFAVQNSLESLINRSRTNPHPHRRGDSNASAPHSPTSLHAHLPPDLTFTAASPDGRNDDDINGSGTRDRRRSSGYVHRPAFTTIREVSYDEGAAILLHDDDDDDNEDNERTGLMRDSGRGSNRRDTRRKSYGATTSEPITVRAGRNRRPSDQITSEAPRASGNSRSRSKARTPPRSDPAPHMISEPSSVNTDDTALLDDHPSPALEDIDARVGGRDDYRGRAVESRPLSPVSTKHSESASGYTRAGRRLSVSTRFADDSSGDEGGDVARGIVATGGGAVFGGRAGLGMTPATSSLPGGGPGVVNTGIGIMDLDPAEELDAVDLELPVAEDGTEARNWVDAVKVEIPIIFKMSLPCLFTQLAEWSLVLASVVSIGHLGTAQLAASSLASMTASVSAFSILQGLATSLDTLLPAAWTSSDPSRVGLWTQRQAVVMVFAMIPMFVLWWNIEGVLIFLNQEADVAHLAADYLRYLSFGIPGYGGNVIAKKYLQAQGLMNVPTYVLFIIAPLNLVFNWLFVWGPKGIRLGFVGGAVATALSYNLTFVMLLVYILFYGPREAFYPWSFSSSFSKLGTVTSLGLAGTIMLSSEWWAWEACALAASLLGPTNLAAQSVLLSTASTFYQFPASLGIASAVRCGNLLGAGRGWEAKWASRASFFLSLFLAGSSSTILLIFRKNWGYLFNSDPEVVAIVATVLPYIALFQLTDGIVATAGSVLRALGLHTTGAMINLTSYYIIGLPLGIWLTFTPRYHLGLQGIWIGLSLALGYGSILSAVLVWRADWTRAVERVRERLGLGTRGEIGQDGKWEEEQPVNFGSDEEEYMEDGEAERRLARRASRSSRRRSIKTSIYRGQHGSKSPENGHASAQERRRLLQDGDGDADGE